MKKLLCILTFIAVAMGLNISAVMAATPEVVLEPAIKYSSIKSAVAADGLIYGVDTFYKQSNFFVYNPVTRTVIKNVELTNVEGSWKVLNYGNQILIGGYNKALLLSYDKTTGEVSTLVDLPSDYPTKNHTYIWDMVLDGDTLYFSANNTPTIYEYSLTNNVITNIFTNPNFTFGYYRSLEMVNGVLYAGTGAAAHLYSIDVATGIFTERLPSNLLSSAGIYGLKYVRGVLLYGEGSKFNVYGLNPTTNTTKRYMLNAVKTPHPTSNRGLLTGYTIFQGYGDYVYQFNGTTLLRVKNPSVPTVGVLVNGISVSGLDREATYSLWRNNALVTKTDLYRAGLDQYTSRAYSMVGVPGGVVVAGHGLKFYNEVTKTSVYNKNIGEAKTMCWNGINLYTANYTGATIWKYTLSDIKTPNTALDNAKYKYWKVGGQNRPTDMFCDAKRVVMTSEPEYGKYNGGLNISIIGGTKTVVNTVFHRHTPMSVDVVGDIAYVVTSATGGTGAPPLNEPARFVAYNMVTNTVVFDKILDVNEETLRSIKVFNGSVYIVGGTGKLFKTDMAGNVTDTVLTPIGLKFHVFSGKLYLAAFNDIYTVDSSLTATLVTTTKYPSFLSMSNAGNLYWVNYDSMLSTN